jgi:hypothetical protein
MVVMAVVLKLAAIHRTSCSGKRWAMAAGCAAAPGGVFVRDDMKMNLV